MPDLLNALLKLLQGSALGESVRNSDYLYPLLEASHILGIALLVGPAFSFDLRLLGVGRSTVSVRSAARALLPLSRLGFAIAALTGIVLLSAQATVVAGTAPRRGSSACWCSLASTCWCSIMAFTVASGSGRMPPSPPFAARAGAGVSRLAWTGVIFAGRLLAYT